MTTTGPKRPITGRFLHLIREVGRSLARRSLAQQPVFAGLPHTSRSLEGSPTVRRANGSEVHFLEYRLAYQLHRWDLQCAALEGQIGRPSLTLSGQRGATSLSRQSMPIN